MSLFACVECGVVENTALCGLVRELDGVKRRLVCSQCNPDLGCWHHAFPREQADNGRWEPVPNSRYIQGKEQV